MPDFSRRHFLGAAAAVWSLPRPEQFDLYSLPLFGEEKEEDANPSTEDEFPRQTVVGEFDGALIAEHFSDVRVNVCAYPHQRSIPVTVELLGDGVSMSAGLEIEEARELAREIERAVDDTEQWRARAAPREELADQGEGGA